MISHLGRYEILDELGHGAMGIIYKAKDPLIDRLLAIKTINLNLTQGPREEYETRFYAEAKAAGSLSHPNIVTIYDVGASGDVAFIAMEFLQGRELRDILDDEKQLPAGRAIDIAEQVATGLAYAHEHDIVHRDIKPSNIMVMPDGRVKITDFGIARMLSATVRTQTGVVLGSPSYMSPEQIMGIAVDRRSDIFSLGIVLYEMLTGQVPFEGETLDAIMDRILNATPVPPATLNPAIPEMVNLIAVKALSKRLDERYQNARAFADDLRNSRAVLTQPAAGGMPLSEPPPIPAEKPEAAAPEAAELPAADQAAEEPPAEEPGEGPEEIKQMLTQGLSPAFDSFDATMRLAVMTTTPEKVDEFSRTLRMAPAPALRAVPHIRAKPRAPGDPEPPSDAAERSSSPAPEPGEMDAISSRYGERLIITTGAVLTVLAGVVQVFFF